MKCARLSPKALTKWFPFLIYLLEILAVCIRWLLIFMHAYSCYNLHYYAIIYKIIEEKEAMDKSGNCGPLVDDSVLPDIRLGVRYNNFTFHANKICV